MIKLHLSPSLKILQIAHSSLNCLIQATHPINSLLCHSDDVGSDVGFEFRLRHVQEGHNLLHHGADVVAVHKGKGQLQGTSSDGDVILLHIQNREVWLLSTCACNVQIQ